MLIYKIFRAPEWAALRRDTTTTGAPIDVADGYIHFSTAAQAAETAAKHFAGVDDLFVIAVEADSLGQDLKWEVSRGDALFPHLYREMTLADVQWAQPCLWSTASTISPKALDPVHEGYQLCRPNPHAV